MASGPTGRGADSSPGIYHQSYLFLLVADYAALDRAAVSLRSGDAVGLEDAAASRPREPGRYRHCDCLAAIIIDELRPGFVLCRSGAGSWSKGETTAGF